MTVKSALRKYQLRNIRNIIFILIAACGLVAILLTGFRDNAEVRKINKNPGETYGYIHNVSRNERITQTVGGSQVSVTYNHIIKYKVNDKEYQLTKSTGYVIQKDSVLIRYLIGEPEKAYVIGE